MPQVSTFWEVAASTTIVTEHVSAILDDIRALTTDVLAHKVMPRLSMFVESLTEIYMECGNRIGPPAITIRVLLSCPISEAPGSRLPSYTAMAQADQSL